MKDEIMKDRLHIGEAVDKEDKLVDLLSMNQSMMTMIPVNAQGWIPQIIMALKPQYILESGEELAPGESQILDETGDLVNDHNDTTTLGGFIADDR